MSKADLKAAMESLEVKKPLKLHDRQPQFKVPPTISDPTWVAGETQVAPPAQVAMATEVPLQTKVPVATTVAAPTEVAGTTQVPAATQVIAKEDGTRSANDQDSSVTLEAQTAPKLHQGYTRLPNSILMRMAAGDLIRSEMQILLVVARFTISFQKRHAPLSKTVLERQSGLRGPAILQAISDLQAKGLIEKIPGDQHRPNQLGLVFEDEWEFFSKSNAPTTSVPTQTQVATETQVPVGTPAPVAVQTPAWVAPATPFKDIKIYKNNSSLSELPEKLRTYFSDLKPERKKESEQRAFEEIRRDFSIAEITKCFDYLKRKGLPGEDPCHSPMAYLATAMRGVLEIVQSQESLEKTWAESKARQEAEKQARDEESVREQYEWEIKERAFRQTFTGEDRQTEVIAEICRNKHFPLRGAASRALAISAWFSGLTAHERQEVTE